MGQNTNAYPSGLEGVHNKQKINYSKNPSVTSPGTFLIINSLLSSYLHDCSDDFGISPHIEYDHNWVNIAQNRPRRGGVGGPADSDHLFQD